MAKLWRKLAQKQVNPETGLLTRTGRYIRNYNQQFGNAKPGPTKFLVALFEHAGIKLMAVPLVAAEASEVTA